MGLVDELTNEEALRLMALRGWAMMRGGSPDDDGEGDDDSDDDDETDSGKTETSKEKKFSQSEVEALMKKRLARETRKLTTTLSESIKADLVKEMELETAAKKGDLQKIIDDLKPKADKLSEAEKLLITFEELANTRFDEALSQLPDHIKAFAPDEDASAIEKEKWLIVKAMPAMKKLKKKGIANGDDDEENEEEETPKKRRGMSPFDPPPGGKTNKKTLEEIVKGYESSGAYRSMM